MVRHQEGVLVSSVELTLILIVELNLSLDLLQLLPLVVVDLLQ